MANPTTNSNQKTEKRKIPTPMEWLQANAQNGPQNAGASTGPAGFTQPMTPGATGRTMPTQHSGAVNGIQGGRGPKAPQGQETPASKARGNGKKQTTLSPNNKKKAGSMTHGKPAFGMPSKNALARRLHPPVGASKAPSATNASGRNGILSKFEGFSANRG